MPAGLTANITLASLNQQGGAILLNLVTALAQVQEMWTFLQAEGGSNLTTAYGMTSGDVATFTSAFNDANLLATIFHGGTSESNPTVTVGYDFTASIKLLIGTGVH